MKGGSKSERMKKVFNLFHISEPNCTETLLPTISTTVLREILFIS